MSPELSESFLDNVTGGFQRIWPTASVLNQHIGALPKLLLTQFLSKEWWDSGISLQSYVFKLSNNI